MRVIRKAPGRYRAGWVQACNASQLPSNSPYLARRSPGTELRLSFSNGCRGQKNSLTWASSQNLEFSDITPIVEYYARQGRNLSFMGGDIPNGS